MNRADCIAVIEAFDAAGARTYDYQEHPAGGPYSASSPWRVRSWDHHNLRVEFREKEHAMLWLRNYWLHPDFQAKRA